MSSIPFLQSVASSHVSLAQLWSADSLEQGDGPVLRTGHALLDAQLPGGGWPVGTLIEVLQAQPERHVWQLLLPALAERLRHASGPVVLVGAPHIPFGPALAAGGLPVHRMLWVRCAPPATPGASRLRRPTGSVQRRVSAAAPSAAWACEQALRCANVAAVLAWLPDVRQADLRRLHLAAQQHDNLFFAMRPLAAREESSPARLRVVVGDVPVAGARDQAQPKTQWTQWKQWESGQEKQKSERAESDIGTPDVGRASLAVDVVKRRGPPLAEPLLLAARPLRLDALLTAAPQRHAAASPVDASAALSSPPALPTSLPLSEVRKPLRLVSPAVPPVAVNRLKPSGGTGTEATFRAPVAAGFLVRGTLPQAPPYGPTGVRHALDRPAAS